MRLLSKKKVNFVITLITCCHGHLGNMHFIISYHPCHYLCIHDILLALMHIGSPEGVTLLEFEEEAEDNQGTPQTAAPEREEPDIDELPGVS